MAPMHFMILFLLGIFHFSIGKECLDCANVNDPSAIQYLSDKIKNVTPKGTKNEEEAELVRIKEAEKKFFKGLIHNYDFVAQGLKSNSLYNCKLVLYQQELMGDEVKEFNCNAVSSNKQKRNIHDDNLLKDIQSDFEPIGMVEDKKKRYMQCVKKAAVHCLW